IVEHQLHAATIRLLQRHQRPHERGLAGTVGPQQPEHPVGNGEGHVVERLHAPVRIVLREPFDLQFHGVSPLSLLRVRNQASKAQSSTATVLSSGSRSISLMKGSTPAFAGLPFTVSVSWDADRKSTRL